MAISVIRSAVCVIVLAYFFYRSVWAIIPLSVVGLFFFRNLEKERARTDRRILETQFGEAIRSVATSLKAGYSVENSFIQSGKDMARQYGEDSLIHKEMEIIRKGLIINISLEEMLDDLAERSGCESIRDFSGVFAISKRSGGNMVGIIDDTTETITLMIETREEMAAALSGRKMELKIMKIMPFGILAYVGFTSPGYFDPLYGNVMGIAVMTGLLIIYVFAYVIGDKVLEKLEEG